MNAEEQNKDLLALGKSFLEQGKRSAKEPEQLDMKLECVAPECAPAPAVVGGQGDDLKRELAGLADKVELLSVQSEQQQQQLVTYGIRLDTNDWQCRNAEHGVERCESRLTKSQQEFIAARNVSKLQLSSEIAKVNSGIDLVRQEVQKLTMSMEAELISLKANQIALQKSRDAKASEQMSEIHAQLARLHAAQKAGLTKSAAMENALCECKTHQTTQEQWMISTDEVEDVFRKLHLGVLIATPKSSRNFRSPHFR